MRPAPSTADLCYPQRGSSSRPHSRLVNLLLHVLVFIFFSMKTPFTRKVIGGELQERLIPVPYSKTSTDQAVRNDTNGLPLFHSRFFIILRFCSTIFMFVCFYISKTLYCLYTLHFLYCSHSCMLSLYWLFSLQVAFSINSEKLSKVFKLKSQYRLHVSYVYIIIVHES